LEKSCPLITFQDSFVPFVVFVVKRFLQETHGLFTIFQAREDFRDMCVPKALKIGYEKEKNLAQYRWSCVIGHTNSSLSAGCKDVFCS
jgi:hypothetical protein